MTDERRTQLAEAITRMLADEYFCSDCGSGSEVFAREGATQKIYDLITEAEQDGKSKSKKRPEIRRR